MQFKRKLRDQQAELSLVLVNLVNVISHRLKAASFTYSVDRVAVPNAFVLCMQARKNALKFFRIGEHTIELKGDVNKSVL